jgi:hypothetical protein
MNRFEQAVHECMIPTANLLERTTEPLHRAMLLNFWRHVHLEGSGEFEAITPARVREIHRRQLAKLKAERGDRFSVLGRA